MSYRQVTTDERYYISDALSMGGSKTAIAHRLNRSRSAIYARNPPEPDRNANKPRHKRYGVPIAAPGLGETRYLRAAKGRSQIHGIHEADPGKMLVHRTASKRKAAQNIELQNSGGDLPWTIATVALAMRIRPADHQY